MTLILLMLIGCEANFSTKSHFDPIDEAPKPPPAEGIHNIWSEGEPRYLLSFHSCNNSAGPHRVGKRAGDHKGEGVNESQVASVSSHTETRS